LRRAVAPLALLLLGACSGAGHPASLPVRTTTSSSSTSKTSTSTTTTSTTTAPAPADPASIAAAIAATEPALRDPATPDAALPALALRQQEAYRALAAHPEWDAGVAARLPAGLRPVTTANVVADRELRLLTPPGTRLPAWHIVAPAPAAELLADYHEAERQSGVPWSYLAAINLVETRMGRIRGDSSAGAQGPMQFLPSTWAAYGNGGDIQRDRDAILAAGRYLRANGGPADMASALAHYDHSAHYVRAVTLYAQQLAADPQAFRGYYHWQVFYRLVTGDVLLPEGWPGGS
jgi:membrane-bound lytic murein transglycosylase B